MIGVKSMLVLGILGIAYWVCFRVIFLRLLRSLSIWPLDAFGTSAAVFAGCATFTVCGTFWQELTRASESGVLARYAIQILLLATGIAVTWGVKIYFRSPRGRLRETDRREADA